MSPEEIAKSCSENMHEQDFAAQALGIKIVSSQPNTATLEMKIRKDMVNGHDICHGGMIFTLCDTAFAHACNNTNKVTVASGCNIDFIAPAHQGETLTAIAKERSRSGRTGVFDVEVFNQKSELLAVFRGKSYQIRGHIIDLENEKG